MSELLIHNISSLITPLEKNRDSQIRSVKNISSAAIHLENGRIREIGPESELLSKAPPSIEKFDAKGALALPGLIDCHTHPVFIDNRADEFHMRNAGKSYLEIAASGGGIHASARKTREASVDQIVLEALPRFHRSLQSGVTTIEGKSGYGLTWAGEERLLLALRELKKQIPQRLERTFLIHALPESHFNKRELFCAEVVDEMIPEIAERELASTVDVFCETGAFTIDESRKFLCAAKDIGLSITVHANQFGNSGGALLAAELQARSADHLEYLNDQEIQALSDANVAGVVLPACVFYMGTIPYPPVRSMIESGMRIAVATDMNPGTSMTESIPFCLTAAAIYCRMTPEELLWSVTLDAARAIGCASEVGSLEPGKFADITLWRIPTLESLSYHFGRMEPATVFIGGEVVFTGNDASRQY